MTIDNGDYEKIKYISDQTQTAISEIVRSALDIYLNYEMREETIKFLKKKYGLVNQK
jgi:hypothetical protein